MTMAMLRDYDKKFDSATGSRAHSSVGQSHRLITGRSLVRGQVGPPKYVVEPFDPAVGDMIRSDAPCHGAFLFSGGEGA